MGKKPHVLVVPWPAQGHVAPLMKLALRITLHGIRVTFLNTDTIHAKLMASLPDNLEEQSLLNMVSLPDLGLEIRVGKDAGWTAEATQRIRPGQLKELIEEINDLNPDEQMSCVVADMGLGWVLELAKDMGIEAVGASLPGPGYMALSLQVPQLIESGVLDSEGNLVNEEPISLSSDTPPWRPYDIPWNHKDPYLSKFLFHYSSISSKWIELPTLVLVNSFPELAPSAWKAIPKALPIGPLLASNCSGPFARNIWPEDSTCLSWLDAQASSSVIYVSFGSTKRLSPKQFEELAVGLELTGRPFLWVVRANLVDGPQIKFPDGFLSRRVGERAKIVEWAPQERVLAHPSVACFVSHCGWNSTMEGISMGVPFLCWPFIADQFYNRTYICDAWRIGLNLDEDGNGMVSRHEISGKIDTLLSSDAIKGNAFRLKEAAGASIAEGGSSFKNFQTLIETIKN